MPIEGGSSELMKSEATSAKRSAPPPPCLLYPVATPREAVLGRRQDGDPGCPSARRRPPNRISSQPSSRSEHGPARGGRKGSPSRSHRHFRSAAFSRRSQARGTPRSCETGNLQKNSVSIAGDRRTKLAFVSRDHRFRPGATRIVASAARASAARTPRPPVPRIKPSAPLIEGPSGE